MLKKSKGAKGGEASAETRHLAHSILDSSHQIWLAGLGAFARMQQEGSKMFEALVSQGEQLEARTRQVAADTASAARGAAAAKAKEMQKMAGGTWDRLEQVFEDRVARALAKMGVYTQSDVEKLVQRVDALSEAVNRLVNADRAGRPAAREPAAKAARKSRAGGAGKARKTGAGTPRQRRSPTGGSTR